jgi:hypothetical protein
MKTKLLATLGLALYAAFSPPATAADQKPDRTELPVPPPSFKGKIGVSTLKDSTSGWPGTPDKMNPK